MREWDDEIDGAFEAAKRKWRERWCPFPGVPRLTPWTTGCSFEFVGSNFLSYVRYERLVLDQLRQVQHGRWTERRSTARAADELASLEAWVQGERERQVVDDWLARWQRGRALRASKRELDRTRAALGDGRDLDARLERLQHRVWLELRAVRAAVDAELEEGRGRQCIVQALRALPNRPPGIREFRDVEAFVEGDRRRAVGDWPTRIDAAGEDYGYGWRLEDPSRRWDCSEWRVSWIGPETGDTRELYAVETRPRSERHSDGRVWLLGRFDHRDEMRAVVSELESHGQKERNSLAALAWRAVQTNGA
jgi:hypothetical protein